MKAYRKDVREALDGMAHADATETPKKEARRMGVTARTTRRWTHKGPPQVRQMAMYLEDHPNPHRILAHLRAMAESQLRAMTNAELIAEYWRLLLDECEAEARDRACHIGQDSWLDCAATSERDGAVDIRKAAIEREFAARRITRQEVRCG